LHGTISEIVGGYHDGMSEFPPVAEPNLALRVLMMPRDTNHQGTIFGGIILAYVDQAGYIEARRHGLHRWVTASVDRVDFKAPVAIGEVVEFKTRTIRLGRTSVTVQVVVDAERLDGTWSRVTEAQLTMVSVDPHGKAFPFREPPHPSSA
jgi:acyl-CoA thioesterase YciA